MNKEKAQIQEGVLAVILNVLLFGMKFWAGIITGSVALIADAWHTMSDSLSSVFIIIAAKLAAKKPDKEHPFGHGRWEQIASMLVAFLLGMVGYEFLTDSISRFQNRESAVYGALAIIVTIVSILIKELLTQYAFYLGRKHKNPVIIADGWHHRTDSLSSLIVLIGILITKFVSDFWWMDSVLGMLCALAIFYAAFKIIKEAVTKMLGEEPEQEFIEQLNIEIKEKYDEDLQLHHFHLHNYITHKELTLHMMLDKNMSIEKSHEIASSVENTIKNKFEIEATIHVEPR